ncbi:MAG: hypothetical protein WCW44_02995 [archaeon]|jgi:predicted  nucleic acid-binding Zn-ribbon protein
MGSSHNVSFKFLGIALVLIFLISISASAFANPTISISPTVIDSGENIYISGYCDQNPTCKIYESFNGGAFYLIVSGISDGVDYNESRLLVTSGNYSYKTCKTPTSHCTDFGVNVIVTNTHATVDVNDLNAAILQLQNQVSDLNSDVSLLESNVNDLNDSLVALTLQVNDLNAQDANFATQIAEIYSLISDQNQQLIDLQIEIEDINANLNGYVISFNQRSDDLNSLIQDVNQELTLEITDLQNQIDNLNTSLSDVNTQLNARVLALEIKVDSIDSRLTSAEDTLAEMNHGTINIEFRQNTMFLDVSGEAPVGSSTATLKFYKSTTPTVQYGVTYSTPVVTNGSNDNTYLFTQSNGNAIDVTGFDSSIYNVEVSFGIPSGGYKVYTIFSELLLIDVESRTTQLELDVDIIDQQIIDLNAQDANYSAQLAIIYERLAVHDQNIIDLAQSISDLNTALNARIDDLNLELIAQVARLDSRIDALDVRLTDLEIDVALLNAGTLEYTFNKNLAYGLVVKGKIPLNATSGTVEVKNSATGVLLYGPETVIIDFTQNTYSKNIQVSALENDILTITVKFKGFGVNNNRYTLSASFVELLLLDVDERVVYIEGQLPLIDANIAQLHAQDANFQAQLDNVYAHLAVHDQNIIDLAQSIDDLNTALNARINDLNAELIAQVARLDSRIDALDVRLTALENTVDAMNHGTLYLAYDHDNSNGRLIAKGEAAVGTVKVKIEVLNIDQAVIKTVFDASINSANNEYSKTFNNVNDWDKQIYEIRATFLDSSNNQIGQKVNVQFYALQELMQFQGFGYEDSDRQTYFLVLPTSFPINFSFGAVETGQYDFNLVLTDGTTTTNQQLLTSYMVKFNSQSFNARYAVPNKGNWSAKLIALNENTLTTIESNDFNIELADLYDPIRGATNIASPSYNDNILSAQRNTYYTNKDFNLTSTMGGTNIGTLCYIRLVNINRNLWEQIVDGNICTSTVFQPGMLGENEGLFKIKVLNALTNITPADFNLGIDYTKPVINAIIPSTDYHGALLYVDVNTIDSLSGVESVTVYMIDKNTKVVANSAIAAYNSTSMLWEAVFDTDGMLDTFYDINAEVTDAAGNTQIATVDPAVDNTAPVIDENSITITQNPMLRNNTITIDVNVTDKVPGVIAYSGINTVKATISDGNLIKTIFLTRKNNDLFEGTFTTDTNWNTGLYTIAIDANDNSIRKDSNGLTLPSNQAVQKTKDANLFQNYYFNVSNQSRQIPSGTTTTFNVDGNFRNDLGSTGPFTDGNTILVTSNIVGVTSVMFDENGFFTIPTNGLNAGTYYVDLNYNTTDYNYTTRVTLSVSNPSTYSGGGGGGSSGALRPSATDVNTPVETPAVETPVQPIEEVQDTNTITSPADTNTSVETTSPEETPSGPTGLFGLGDIGGFPIAGLGLLVLILVAGGLFLVFKKN